MLGGASEPVEDLFPRQWIAKVTPILALTVLVYVGLFFVSDSKSAAHELRHVSYASMFVAVLLSLASFVLRGVRWHYYLRVGGTKVPVLDGFLVFLIGLVLSLSPGKLGEIVKSLLLKDAWQVPVAKTAPILLAERVTDLVAVLLLGGGGLLAIPEARLAGVAVIAGALGLVGLCRIESLGLLAIRIASRVPWVRRRSEKLTVAYSALTRMFAIGPLATAMLLSVLAWGLQSQCVSTVASSFPNAPIGLAGGLVIFCGPLLAGALALIPGGLGATEASMTGLLMGLSGPSMTLGEAIAITVLFRLVTLWLAIALGLAGLLIWRIRMRAKGAALASAVTPGSA